MSRLNRRVRLALCFAVMLAAAPFVPLVRPSAVSAAPDEGINAVAWSPDNALLAVGSAAGVTLYRTSDWQPVADWRLPNAEAITALAWDADGARIAGGSSAGAVYLWRVADGAPDAPLTLRGPGKAIRALSWSPDGTALAAASGEPSALVWDAASGRIRTVLRHEGPVFALDWGDTALATGGAVADTYERGFVWLWDAQRGTRLRGYRADMRPALRLQWRPGQTGTQAARLGVLTRYQMFEWDTATDETLPIDMLLSDGAHSLTFDWSPSGAWFGGANYQSATPGSLVFVRGEALAGQFTLAARTERRVQALEFSANDRHLAVLDDGGGLRILDSRTARQLWSR